MAQATTAPARFLALDALRGICALLVVLFHIPVYHALKDVPAFANLQLCVDMFFVLSGFVLYHAYGHRIASAGDGMRFMAMRFARLWPLHMAMLVLLVALEAAKLGYSHADTSLALDARPFATGHSVYEIATNVLFLQSFGLHPGLSWNGPAWSAAVEFYVSILFVAVMLAFPRRHRAVFLVLSLSGGALLYLVSPQTLFVSTDWGILRAIFGFFAGCLVYDLKARAGGMLRAPTLLEGGALALLIGFAVLVPAGPWLYAFPLVAGAAIYVFSFDQGRLAAALRTPALQKLGLWSFSIYMIHVFIFQIMKSSAAFVGHKTGLALTTWHADEKLVVLGTPIQALLPTLVLSIVLVVPLAALTYRWIERPALEAARRGLGPTRAAGTRAAAEAGPMAQGAAA